ncbi:ABC transporter ATP-binding protein [Thermomonospora amylolytica]|uniref:ABC transporter ATP-binding protein n=1 Tax=Thermomonospora amylolytica TaxID=1411117 RepID=UPI000E6C1BDE|nr:ABC transporter ATP-binding protein [Thermomonospora amylolytica]
MRLERVAFRYRRSAPWVLRDVVLSLEPGTITEVTGRNGAGKSTLLRLVAGLRRPSRGTVTGRPRNVGYAPERFPVAQPFTVRAYLTHMAAVRGLPGTAADPWIERLALGPLLNTRLPELSKGSAQKVGIAQALLAHPGLLVLDEPFAGLDPTTRDALPALAAELARHGSTLVISDHQRCIADLPGVRRVRVADSTVTPLTSDDPPNAPPTWTVLEVTVRSDEAEALAAELESRGHTVTARPPSAPAATPPT